MDRNTERHGCYLLLVLALVVPALSVEMTFLYEDEGSGMTCSYVYMMLMQTASPWLFACSYYLDAQCLVNRLFELKL